MVKPSSAVSPYPPSSFPSTSSGSAPPVEPTWQGFVHTSYDALVIVEACLQGKLNHIARRPHDRERSTLIVSGNIFVYEENASGIKRWTDGMTWSPSRIMGNFLVYRELDKPWPQGQKKVAQKRKRSADHTADSATAEGSTQVGQPCEEDRRLVGSLVDSYGFKPNGLVKRTMTISYNGVAHHVICYYTVSDVKDGVLSRPGFDPNLKDIKPRTELVNNTTLKFPIHDPDEIEPYPTQSSQVSHLAQPVFQPNYTMHQPHSFQVQPVPTLSVQAPYDMSHFHSGQSFSQPMQPTSHISITSYQPMPVEHDTMNRMPSTYSHANLTLQTNLMPSFKREYGNGVHDSGVSTPDQSNGNLGIDPSEQLHPTKRVRITANANTSMMVPPVSTGTEYEHNPDPLAIPTDWSYDSYSPVANLPNDTFSTSNAFYVMHTMVDHANLFSGHPPAQPYSI